MREAIRITLIDIRKLYAEPGKTVDTAGLFTDEFLFTSSFLKGMNSNLLQKSIYVTYSSEAYSLYRVEALLRVNNSENVFDNELFAYHDDHLLGLKLWNNGYKVKVIPVPVAIHLHGATFRKILLIRIYLNIRGVIILNEVLNSRYKHLIYLFYIRRALISKIYNIVNLHRKDKDSDVSKYIIRAIVDGIKVGQKKRSKMRTMDLYKAPILSVSLADAFLRLILPLSVIEKSRKIK